MHSPIRRLKICQEILSSASRSGSWVEAAAGGKADGRTTSGSTVAGGDGPGWGIGTSVPQAGHLACLPAVSSAVLSSLWQCVHRNSIGIVFPSIVRRGQGNL